MYGMVNKSNQIKYDHIPRIEDVGLPTKFRFNVGPALQLIAGSMPVNCLRRWPNTRPLLGLLYTRQQTHDIYPMLFQC